MAKDKTEGVFKIIGYVGAAIAGLGAVGLNAWKTMKEADSMKTEKTETPEPEKISCTIIASEEDMKKLEEHSI